MTEGNPSLKLNSRYRNESDLNSCSSREFDLNSLTVCEYWSDSQVQHESLEVNKDKNSGVHRLALGNFFSNTHKHTDPVVDSGTSD